ncbi:GNAT family N-acetyltransferase [Paracraurococcus ruber]|uniref:GNAT family N-acetyltransferase n=1 Tax=Paracraurococcus ruber TaxID=77675 RepID=A0ABS1D458_9PROT|nr:GNAT family N-acetyltransferase [Paracraurococcus ruber]MBK1661251.1 GNAT family N-acetyltransferase [Paracraurococcus ruber]TDG31849.1 GNAT family N-acetyltransferase [Paracraurococcus ruber]
MICIRRAGPADATAIGAVHVATWRSSYAGVLPEAYLTGLSSLRHALGYERAIADRRHGHAVFVAVASGPDAPGGRPGPEGGTIIGFVSGGHARRDWLAQGKLQGEVQGEVETLYLLEDYRDRGIGRRLMRAMAAHLAAVGCRSAMLWVLRDNPTRWFYQRLGGRQAGREMIRFAGQAMEQLAFVWDPIDTLLAATATAPEGS